MLPSEGTLTWISDRLFCSLLLSIQLMTTSAQQTIFHPGHAEAWQSSVCIPASCSLHLSHKTNSCQLYTAAAEHCLALHGWSKDMLCCQGCCRYFSSPGAFILVASQNASPQYVFCSGKIDLDSSLPSLCHFFLLPHQSSAMLLCKCSHLWGSAVRQSRTIRGPKNKLSSGGNRSKT